MFGYLLGALSAVNSNQNDSELETVDTQKLEEVRGEAKRIQFPEKYIMDQAMVDKEMPANNMKYNSNVADILTKMLSVSNLSKSEMIVLMGELKTYKKEGD